MKRLSSLLLLAAAILIASCQGGGGPKYFDWPIKVAKHDPRNLWSNLGEVRGALGDGPNWLNHGATDFKTTGGLSVYASDVGTVRFGEDSDKKSGQPPVKIGHFSMLHFKDVNNLNVNPAVLGDATIWTVVVRPDDDIQLTPTGAVTTLRKLRKTIARGVRKQGSAWEQVFFYSINEPIGQAEGADLHTIYYETEDSAYKDVSDIRNVLSVIEYENPKLPEIQVVRLFSQKVVTGLARELILEAPGSGVMSIANDGGVDIVVTSSSFATGDARAGIYELAWAVDRFLTATEEVPPTSVTGPGNKKMVPVVSETIMYTYDRMPDRAKDENLVARLPKFVLPTGDISSFNSVDTRKYTAYVVTNTQGDDAKHWELEDITKFPDGTYLLTVTARNIKKSHGIGVKPTLGEFALKYYVDVVTMHAGGDRKITVRKV
jgi:hypothetical protein